MSFCLEGIKCNQFVCIQFTMVKAEILSFTTKNEMRTLMYFPNIEFASLLKKWKQFIFEVKHLE
jgi:hypothetical protein